MRRLLRFAVGVALLAAGGAPAIAQDAAGVPATPPVVAPADADAAAFATFLAGIRTRAIAAGVSAATVDANFAGLTPNPRVVQLDRGQPGGNPNQAAGAIEPFAPYKAQHVDAKRIGRGRDRYPRLAPILAKYEAQTGVPEKVMLAIFGHETDYGGYTGDFDLIRSLATLAYEGRRRELFSDELVAALKLLDGGLPRARLKGSWAGATGYPQFLPSMVLKLAADGDGDGKKDIWGSEADALASIGNYLVNAGWRPNVPWGIAVLVPQSLDRASLKTRLVAPRCPRVFARHTRWLTIAEWKKLGVTPTAAVGVRDEELATLLEPDGPGATAYLLTTNYRSILDYNCSNFYALSVGLLADEVAR